MTAKQTTTAAPPCRHDRYRVPRHHCYTTGEPLVWHCLRCGALLEPQTIGKTTFWQVVGYEYLVHIQDVWRKMKARNAD